MPRAHRQLLEGGLYHVYNRFSRGEEIFADPDEADRFVGMIREAKKRDGFIVYAWCLMSNHYHLALRTSAIPLSRTMGILQGGFSRSFNQRRRRTGPVWQSRYQGPPGRRPALLRPARRLRPPQPGSCGPGRGSGGPLALRAPRAAWQGQESPCRRRRGAARVRTDAPCCSPLLREAAGGRDRNRLRVPHPAQAPLVEPRP